MKIQAVVEYRVERASAEDCDRFGKPYGKMELLDSDGCRLAWVDDVEEAKTEILMQHFGSFGLNEVKLVEK